MCGQRKTDAVKRHLKCCRSSYRSHYLNPHKIKLCLPIPQLSAAKSSLLGDVQIKTERSQALFRRPDQEPALFMQESARQDLCIQ